MERKVDRRYLEKYLAEHLVASQSCLQRIQSLRFAWHGTDVEPELDSVYEEVRDDRNDLRAIVGRMELRETSRPWWRKFTTGGASCAPVRTTGSQMELDVISGLLHSKLAMWNTLLSLVTSESRLDPVQLITLADRTKHQIRAMAHISEQVRPDQFMQPS